MTNSDPSDSSEKSSKPRRRRRSRSRSKKSSSQGQGSSEGVATVQEGQAVPQEMPKSQDVDGNVREPEKAAGTSKSKPRSRSRSRSSKASKARQDSPSASVGAEESETQGLTTAVGVLEMSNKSDGRLRRLDDTYVNDPDDPVVASHLIEKYHLRPGLKLEVSLGKAAGGGGGGPSWKKGKKGKFQKPRRVKSNAISALARRAKEVLQVEGMDPQEMEDYRSYEELTTIMPQPRIKLEYPGCPPACRLMDLFCPIGFGTRGMIVSPPKAGKTTLLHNIATAIAYNHPEVEVYALLIDERPEEVTDFRRNVPCTVWASSNDHALERHVGLAQLAIERCKRHAEMGKDVVVLLDSLTRLGRAFNTAPGIQGTGRTLSGGLDAGALAIPKQLFGGARKFEEGGSLTIIASALVDTGSRGDQVIFEEFKGTGNMEVILDRKISEQRVFPAIDLAASGTRNEHLLLSPAELETVTALRRRLLSMQPMTQIEQLLKALERYETNAEMVGDSQKRSSPVG
ncbi:MAG: transcription termination factor Rho [Algisphaera sp.]